MPAQQNPDGSITVTVYSTSGGINERAKPWFLPEDQVAANSGWDASYNGQRKKRGGCLPYYSPAVSGFSGFTGSPLGMFGSNTNYWGDSDTVRWGLKQWNSLISVWGKSVLRTSWWGYTEELFDSDDTTAGYHTWADDIPKVGVYAYFKVYDNPNYYIRRHLCLCDSRCHESGYSSASNLTLFAADRYDILKGYASIPHVRSSGERPTAMAFLQGRLWVGCDQGYFTGYTGSVIGFQDGSRATFGSDIRPSELYDPTFTHPAIFVEPGTGGRIVALWPLRLSDPALLVFKRYAIAIFHPRWGSDSSYIPTTGDTIDTVASKVTLLSSEIGCAAPKTVAEVPGPSGTDLWFLASDGQVRRFSRVSQDTPAGGGESITHNQPELMNRISASAIQDSEAVFYDNKYVLSVPLDESDSLTHIIVIDTRSGAVLSVENLPFAGLCTQHGIIGALNETSGAMPINSAAPVLYGQHPTAYSGSWIVDTEGEYFDSTLRYGKHIHSIFDWRSYYDPGYSCVEAIEDTPGFTFGTLKEVKRWDKIGVMAEACTRFTGVLGVEYAIAPDEFTALGTMYFPPVTSGRKLRVQKLSLVDVDPDYSIQFRLTSNDYSRMSIVYTECTAKVIREEVDNSIT